MNYLLYGLIIFILIIIIYKLYQKYYTVEGYGGGALTQLYAKGPQDTYLTFDTEKYIPEYWWNYPPFHYYKWNIPTRYNNYYYPLYGIFPNPSYTYPYNYL